jgi:hypothetical protein
MKRPAGITVIAIVFIVMAIISLLWSALIFGIGGLSSLVGGLFGAGNLEAFGISTGMAGFLGLIVAIVQFVVAFGLLAMKKWSWILALIGVGLTVIQGLVNMFSGGAFGFMCGSIGLIIPVIILIYLLQPSVRSIFGVGSEASESPAEPPAEPPVEPPVEPPAEPPVEPPTEPPAEPPADSGLE